ncbi:choline kinase [Mycoplasma wenyonii]|uniref:Choline kinase n=1 Tax=Mycoplasma wenyonii TaxID=65123 RepID=A0A328PJU4_9MOLU|nr:phosphotransferase [Mycoplasma wenyonii]RAO95092.1 choline kinase [Mycoplasma wenyonii]
MAKELAKKFFLDNFPQFRAQIRTFKKILVGFSNQIFQITLLDGRSYKVRIADNNHLISRKNEQEVLKLVPDPNLIVYDSATGNAIYKWIVGDQLSARLLDRNLLERIVELATEYHSIPVSELKNITEHDHFDTISKVDQDRQEYSEYFPVYKELVEKYQDLPKILTHNDISLKNLIYSNYYGIENLTLIDYEWARLNTIYWEYGNFARECQLTKDKIMLLAQMLNLNKEILLDFVFIATFYSWQLSFSWDRSERLEKYRGKLISQLEKYMSWRS